MNLLRNFTGVRTKFLLQTFSKEILVGPVDARVTHRHTRQTGGVKEEEEGEEKDDAVLLDSTGAGTLIIALEDEFYEVRLAATRTIARLAAGSKVSITHARGICTTSSGVSR